MNLPKKSDKDPSRDDSDPNDRVHNIFGGNL